MYDLKYSWKSFNLNMDAVEAWMRSNAGAYYCGNSTSTDLTLHFTSEPGETVKAAINTYWDKLTEKSTEAASYVPQSAIKDAINSLKTGLLTKSWDQMSVAERKLVLGQMPTRSELGL